MKTPGRPADETQRLSALLEYDILDTPPEADFDGLTTLVAHILEVPIALISIVDSQRQWFKSRHGLTVTETSREVSFCGHVVADGAPLVVPDALTDPRFHDNPLVQGEPHIRFYAGFPLRTGTGFVLGTLCGIDDKPRDLSPRQRELLGVLAAQVVAQLELRHRAIALSRDRQRLAVFRRFFELGQELFATASHDFRLRDLNPAWSATLGWSLEELHDRVFLDLVHPDDLAQTAREATRLLESGSSTVGFLTRHRHKDGHYVPLSWIGTVHEGTFFAAARDVSRELAEATALKQSEEQFRLAEARLRALFDGLVEGVVVQDRSGAILTSNQAAERILGLTRDQLMGRTSVDPQWRCIHADGSPFPGESHPAMVTLRTGKPLRGVIMGVYQLSGELRWININSEPTFANGDSLPAAVVTTFRDTTEQVEAEKLVARERAFLATVLSKMPSTTVAVFDGELRLEQVFGPDATNAARSTGLLGRPVTDLPFADRVGRLERAARACLTGEETKLDCLLGERRLEVTFVPLGPEDQSAPKGLLLAYDVTERDTLRERISQHERLVTTGTLAAGVGHEINNPLTYVIANLDFVIDEVRAFGGLSPSSRMREILTVLGEAREGAERIRKIVRGLRAFARQDGVPVAMDVGVALEISANMAMHEVRQRAGLTIDRVAVPPVFADESRLSQVFVNLIVNAAQAFLESDPSRNRITVTSGLSDDGLVTVDVADNGPGIPPDVLPRIFDPFFTTKPVGLGTGLGLSICHSIVSDLGGTLTCETQVGKGTVFRLALPRASATQLQQADGARPGKTPGSRGRVLVVDDDPSILRSTKRLLGDDHDVAVEVDSREALRRLTEAGEAFDVVFCDIMMPSLSGPELFRRVRELRPPLADRFVFMTGGAVYPEVRRFLAEVPNERLEKPFSSQNLRGIARRFVRR